MVEWVMRQIDDLELDIFAVQRLFPDEKSAERWLVRTRWPQGRRCPHCGFSDTYETPHRKPQPYRCRDCGCYFSIRTGTVMGNSRLPLLKWVYAVYFMESSPKGMPSTQLANRLGVTQKTAWYLAHRIRRAWQEDTPAHYEGPIEVDETYVGGIERNRHIGDSIGAAKLRYKGKTPVMGMKDRATGRVSAVVLDYVNKDEAVEFIFPRIDEGTPIYTDEAVIYHYLPAQSSVTHSRRQYRDGDCYTNGIESFWAILKRAHKGKFHSMSYKHLQRYVDELASKQGRQHVPILRRMEATFQDMVGCSLPYQTLIAD